MNSDDSESLPFLRQAAKKNSALYYRSIETPSSSIFNRQGLLAAVGHGKKASNSRERKLSRKEQFVAAELAADYENRSTVVSRVGSQQILEIPEPSTDVS